MMAKQQPFTPPQHKFAYTAIVERDGYIIGLTELNVKGYSPKPILGRFTDYEIAKQEADKLNKTLFGIERDEAIKIVLSSMEWK